MAVSNQQSRDAALLRATTELFVLSAKHDADEVRRFEELATHFLGRVSAADRAFVAERLAKTKDAPTSVLRLLGKDLIEIASPILRRSEALSEIDLLSILSSTGPLHHRLIAQRPLLPSPVVAALRLTGDPETLTLLESYPVEAAAPAEPVPATLKPQPLISDAPRATASGIAKPAPRAPDPAAREVYATARAMTAALSLEMTSFAILSEDRQPKKVAAPELEVAIEPAPPESDIPVPPPEPDSAPSIDADLPSVAVEASVPARGTAIAHFLQLDARERMEALVEMLGRAGPADPGMTPLDADTAFRVALGSARVSLLARRRQRDALIEALANGLRLDRDSVTAIADDPSGEALVILLRAIGLSEAEAHQVLLFANPAIAEAVETFFRLARLSGEVGREAADRIVASWRGGETRPTGHQPILADVEMRRTIRGETSRRRESERSDDITERRTAS